MRCAAVPLAVVGLLGCADTTSTTGTTREAIVNGSVDTSAHDAVVRLNFPDGAQCTGTLVAPNLVLTARHCVSRVDRDTFYCNADGTTTGGTGSIIRGDLDPATIGITGGVDANASTVLTAVGGTLVVDPSTTTCHHDLAFLILAANVSLPYVAIRRSAVVVGEELTLAGYGLAGTGPTNGGLVPEAPPAERRTRTNVRVLAVGAGVSDGADTLGAAEFSIGEGPCEGDSGGPALTADGSVVGVVSHGETECRGADAVTILSDVTKYPDLVARAFTTAGHGANGPPPFVAPKADADSGCRVTPRAANADLLAVLVALVILREATARCRRRGPL